MKQLVILAGGKGTRIKRYFNVPKLLLKVYGKPLLYWHIRLAEKYHFKKILLITGYKSDFIENYLKKFKTHIKIEIFKEDVLKGTGGALLKSYDYLDKNFILTYGDVLSNINLNNFYKYHLKKKADVTVFTHPNDHPESSDIVIKENNDRIVKVLKYPHNKKFYPNLAISASFCINKNFLNKEKFYKNKKTDFIKDIISKNLDHKIFSYQGIDFIKDCGQKKRLEKINKNLNILFQVKNFTNKKKCIFLDMDGTIVHEIGHLNHYKKLKFYSNIENSIRKINESNFLCVLVTNKPVVARGECSLQMLDKIFCNLEKYLSLSSAYLDKIYFCPHHPEKGFKNEIRNLKISCNCRKPKKGLIIKAKNEMNINLSNSWMIGDTTTDIKLGKSTGMKTILLNTGFKGEDNKFKVKPDYNFNNFNAAINFILRRHDNK